MISRQLCTGLVTLILVATNPPAVRAVGPGGSPPGAASEWTVEPGARIGVITRQTTEAELVTLLGKRNVRRARIDIGEGATRPGTLVFSGTAEEVKLFWKGDGYSSTRIWSNYALQSSANARLVEAHPTAHTRGHRDRHEIGGACSLEWAPLSTPRAGLGPQRHRQFLE
jgi:hypothetical protein